MISIARAILLHDKVRFLITVAGLGLVMVLILYNLATFFGTVGESVNLIDRSPADLWALEEEYGDIFAPSLVPDSVLQRARTLDGVMAACPLSLIQGNVEIAESHAVQIVGLDAACGLIQPWDVVAGSLADLRRPNAAVVDDFVLRGDPARLGDVVEVNGREVRIVAITHYNKGFFTPYVYVNRRTFEGLGGPPGHSSFVAIQLEPGADSQAVAHRLANGSETAVYRAEALKVNSAVALTTQGLGAIFVVVAMGLLVGTLIITLTIYTATLEQLRDFAVLKAIGAPNGTILRIVLEETITETAASFAVGLGLSLLMNYVIETTIGMRAIFVPAAMAGTFVVVILLAVAGSLISVRKALAVDPVVVFRA
jgi:putative ABC transport system permease protein